MTVHPLTTAEKKFHWNHFFAKLLLGMESWCRLKWVSRPSWFELDPGLVFIRSETYIIQCNNYSLSIRCYSNRSFWGSILFQFVCFLLNYFDYLCAFQMQFRMNFECNFEFDFFSYQGFWFGKFWKSFENFRKLFNEITGKDKSQTLIHNVSFEHNEFICLPIIRGSY